MKFNLVSIPGYVETTRASTKQYECKVKKENDRLYLWNIANHLERTYSDTNVIVDRIRQIAKSIV